MLRYLALRQANNTQLCCRIADFAAFIATVTTVLSFLNTSQHHDKTDVHQQDEADKNLVQQIVDAMESLSRSTKRQGDKDTSYSSEHLRPHSWEFTAYFTILRYHLHISGSVT